MKYQHWFLVVGCVAILQLACGSDSSSPPASGGSAGHAGDANEAGAENPSPGGSAGDTGESSFGAAGNGGDAGEPAAPEGGSASNDPRSIGFFIDVPGAEQPVAARVASAKSPAIVVQSYPTNLTLPIRYALLPVGFEGAFSDAYCADVRSTANLASVDALKEVVRRMLRRQGSVTAKIPVSSVLGPMFVAASLTAARAAGSDAAAFIDNPVTLSSSQVTLELAPDAISNILGDVPSLLESVSKPLAQQAKIAYQTGEFSASIPGKDLWCDLAQGKAAFHLKVAGKVGRQAYAAETILTRVKPL